MGSDPATRDRAGDSTGPSRRKLLTAIGTAGIATGLTGCSEVVSREIVATPVVLGPPGQQLLGLTESRAEKLTETVTLGEELDRVKATSYLAVHTRPPERDPPLRFGVPAPGARSVGVLSMPSPDAVGERIDPLATEPLGDVLAGERGRQFLDRTGAVDTPEFTWEREPTVIGSREVELLDTSGEARRYLGIAAGADASRTLLMNLVRVPHGEDVVLAGEFAWRTTPDQPLDADVGCVDEFCQVSAEEAEKWERVERTKERLIACPNAVSGGSVDISVGDCVRSSKGSSYDPTFPSVGVTDARLVQQVEDTVVKEPGEPPIHEEDNPDLVEGEDTAIVFELSTLKNLDQMTLESLHLEIYRDTAASRPDEFVGEVEIPKKDLEKIRDGTEHTVSVLHRNSRPSEPPEKHHPVFELESPGKYWLSSTSGYTDVSVNVTPNDGGARDVVEVEPLTVGFIALVDEQDGDRYGDPNGEPRDFERSFRSASEFIQRAYPGDVVTYGHTDHDVNGKGGFFCINNCAIDRDQERAYGRLNRLAADPSYPPNGKGFPDGGILRTDGRNRSKVVDDIETHGFDVVVAIVPGNDDDNGGAVSYFDHWNRGASGVGAEHPKEAVMATGVKPENNDEGISHTAGQEVGHYLQGNYLDPSGHPMAQRSDETATDYDKSVDGVPIDPAHARHQGSNLVDDEPTDEPGVVSTAYDLKGGFANVQHYKNSDGEFTAHGPGYGSTSKDTVGKVSSFMSYDLDESARVWADARIHQQFIDNDWEASGVAAGLAGSGERRYMLSASGIVLEEAAVRYVEVTAMPGFEEYVDREDAPVEVELLDPDGEVLASARVPVTSRSHHGGEGDSVEAPSFSLPFRQRGVRVRTTYDGREVFMNPIERAVRDAVTAVPEAGFRGDPEVARETIGESITRVHRAMEEGEYGTAADVLDGAVREQLREHVTEYDATLDEPSLPELLDLVDELVRRLRDVAGTRG